MGKERATDEQIAAAYAEHGSVHKAGRALNMRGGSVHERLVKLGLNKPLNVLTDGDYDRLKRDYVAYRDTGRIKILAAEMGRTVPFLCRAARRLGLTDQSAPKVALAVWKYMSREQALVIWDEFKVSPAPMGQWCLDKGYDDLGFSRTMLHFFPDEWEYVLESKTPRNTCYYAGRQFEHVVKRLLEEAGYDVLRSSMSKGPMDLVAVRMGECLLIQCKSNEYQLLVEEWDHLLALAHSIGATPIMASLTDHRQPILFRLMGRKTDVKGHRPLEVFQVRHAGEQP